MTEKIKQKTILITIKDNNYNQPVVKVTGDFNASQARRALNGAMKHIRTEATRSHYAKQYEDEAKAQKLINDAEENKAKEDAAWEKKENARLAKELKDADIDDGVEEKTGANNEEDDNDLSYLNDSDNGKQKEDK